MSNLPDQKRLWDAYGHAMAASIGLELLMRIALINAATQELIKERRIDQESRDCALAKIQGMTFGRTVKMFKRAFPAFAENAAFCESIGNAISSRNYLAHNFLEGILHGLRSDEGIELAALECAERTEHFRSLENHVREHCPVDYDAFFRMGEGKAEQYVQNHPLRYKLHAIKRGAEPNAVA